MGIDANVSLKPSGEPELPRVYVDTTYYAPTGDTIHVASGGDLQQAIDDAVLGDVITIEAGATFTGPFTLPDKGAGTDYIILRTDTTDQNFVAEGTRVAPADASLMPHIVSASSPTIGTTGAAHHYRLVGLDISSTAGVHLTTLFAAGDALAITEAAQAHHLIVDRCYLHGDATVGCRRGIGLNSMTSAVIDSYITDCKEVGRDTQAIGGWNGAGPYRIANNYLEGAGENLMFGGTDPDIPDLLPSDIEIVRNHFYKPLNWKSDDLSWDSSTWQIKNILELKMGRRVLIEGNLFEHSWVNSGQRGFAISLKSTNQEGTAPWSQVVDITFRNNVIRGANAGFSLLGEDTNYGGAHTTRVAIRNNLLVDIGSTWGGTDGKAAQLMNEAYGFIFEHNTIQLADSTAWGIATFTYSTGYVCLVTDFVWRYNITPYCLYGVKGDGTASGTATLSYYCPGYVFTENVITDQSSSAGYYPSGNYWPTTLADVDFEDLDGGDFRLSATSDYRAGGPNGASDGKAMGIDKAALDAAMGDMAQTYW